MQKTITPAYFHNTEKYKQEKKKVKKMSRFRFRFSLSHTIRSPLSDIISLAKKHCNFPNFNKRLIKEKNTFQRNISLCEKHCLKHYKKCSKCDQYFSVTHKISREKFPNYIHHSFMTL